MQQYAWPGNIRELRNYVERAVILSSGSRIELIDLPEKISRSTEDSRPTGIRVGDLVALELLEQEHIQRVMEKAETIEAAARILGVNPATLYRKRKRMTPEPG
jgi:NtrC-family two-component system response regulator AlgB